MLPILAAYELGVKLLTRPESATLRTGVDAWLHQVLGRLGFPQPWLPAAVLLVCLIVWLVVDRRPGGFRLRCLPGMAIESVILAVVLVGLGRLVDMGLSHLEEARAVPLTASAIETGSAHPLAPIVGYLGAGIYEEALFRLALIPLLYGVLRLLLTPSLLAGTLAVTGSALLFSIAHHAGPPGEAFTWYAFFFSMGGGDFLRLGVHREGFRSRGRHACRVRCAGGLDWLMESPPPGPFSCATFRSRGDTDIEPCGSSTFPTSTSGGTRKNPLHLFSKRTVGVVELLSGRARKFRLERLSHVVTHVLSLKPDHVLITGDLTTTALGSEFREARAELAELLDDPSRVTIIPGNHDRYTARSVRRRTFEKNFGEFSPEGPYPWLRHLDDETAILGLDPTRAHLSARGFLPLEQLERAHVLGRERPERLIVACHYPLAAPPNYQAQLAPKRLKNAEIVSEWASSLGPHLFCCGHVHAAWSFVPPKIPNQLCLNAGAPLLRDPTGFHFPGFLEIELDSRSVNVTHHAWNEEEWLAVPMVSHPDFYGGVRSGV